MARRSHPDPADYAELLRDGLDTYKSYIVLKQKQRAGIYLCFRPLVDRLSTHIMYVGGKLSIFAEKTKVQSVSGSSEAQNELQEVLRTAWRKLPCDRLNFRRCGSNAGFYVAGTFRDQEAVEKNFNGTKLVNTMLKGIAGALGVTIDNEDEVRAFLLAFYQSHMENFFQSASGGQAVYGTASPRATAGKMAGKASKLVLGMQELYTGRVGKNRKGQIQGQFHGTFQRFYKDAHGEALKVPASA